MAETVTFANFDMTQGNVHDIGKSPEYERSVAGDIALAFGGSTEELGDLLGKVAPHKDLKDNIALARETLSKPEVQKKLGYEPGTNPHQIGHDWAMRAGLQTPVFRPFMESHTGDTPEFFDAAIIPDRVVRWMGRMGNLAVEVSNSNASISELLIVPTKRTITKEESEEHAGLTRKQYAARELVPHVSEEGDFGFVTLAKALPSDAKGALVMEEVADFVDTRYDLANPETRIVLPAVAGNWMQTGAQARKAFQGYAKSFDDTPGNRQLWVCSDQFDTDPTGTKPPSEAQDSLSAVGNFLRGVKLIKDLQNQARA